MGLLTVKGLIAKLKKMPPGARVAWRDHDQSDNEINGYATRVDLGSDELHAERIRQGDGAGKIVVLS